MEDSRTSDRAEPAEQDRLERAAELYLQTCYAVRSAARADDFASHLRISRFQLSRTVTGTTLRKLLRAKQLAYAQQLLRATPLPVDEIAIATAFGTSWTFFRCFKNAFGITPDEYRRRSRCSRTE